jgi:tetratricopeptide (TPR) repeat protein
VNRALPLLVLFGLIVLALLALALPLDRGPFTGSVQSVEGRFWESANRLHDHGRTELKRDLTPSPLYSLVLSRVVRSGLGAIRDTRHVLVLLFLPLISLLVTALAWRSHPGWPAAVSGAATLVVAPVLLDVGTFTPAVPAVVLALCALLLLSFRAPTASWILAGVILAVVVRLLPLLGWTLALTVLIALALRRDTGKRWRALGFVGAFLGVTIGLGVSGRLGAAIPSTVGIDVYRGHRSAASGVAPRRGDRDERRWWGPLDYLRESSRIKNERETTSEAAVYWTQRAAIEAVTHPVQELRRDGVKFLATFQGDPSPRGVSAAFMADRAENPWLLRVAIWAGRVFIPLGILGLVAGMWRGARTGDHGISMLVAGAVAGWLAGSITFVDADHRLLSVVSALGGLAPLVHMLVGPTGRRPLWGAAGLVAILAFGFLPAWGAVPGSGIIASDYLELGNAYDREGRGSAAMREYERASGLDPSDPYPRFAIAGMLARDNVLDQATAELEHLREKRPEFVPGLSALAGLYQQQHHWQEAAAVFAELSRLEPWNPEHLNNLGTMYVQVGYFDQATKALEAALAIDPSYKLAADNLESLREKGLSPGAPAGADSLRIAQETILARLRSRDFAAARTSLDSAYSRFGHERVELQFLDGTFYLLTGDSRRAIPLLESAAQRMGDNVPVLANLATAYAGAGRFEDAKRVFNQALLLQPSNLQIQQSLRNIQATEDSLKHADGH